MSEFVKPMAQWSAAIIEVVGIGVIIGITLYTLFYAAMHAIRRTDMEVVFGTLRHRLGRGILLGLEFLVAADIVHTVAVDLSFNTVGVLAIIVIIRTFLSFTLEVELTGYWPWQQKKDS